MIQKHLMQTIDFKKLQFNTHFKNSAFAGTLALRYVKAYFSDDSISGKLQQNKLFINTSNQFLKIEIFKQKRHLVSGINEKLKTLGYNIEINDIYIKSQGNVQGEEEFL